MLCTFCENTATFPKNDWSFNLSSKNEILFNNHVTMHEIMSYNHNYKSV